MALANVSTLIDTNVLIDVWGPFSLASVWSMSAMTACRLDGSLVVNPIVWAELAPLVDREAVLDAASTKLGLEHEALPCAAAFQAGAAHARYRRAGGSRDRTLPDFFIGAHAAVAGHRLLTRDAARYRNYFPGVDIISPDTHP